MDPIEFLRARYDEDERDAKQPPNGHLSHGTDPVGTVNRECPDCRTPYARTRMLAEVEFKRRILDLHHEYDGVCGHCVSSANPPTYREHWPCETVRLMTLLYADHPDYDPAWRI